MKYLLDELKEIQVTTSKKRIGLFLDFDGTLASISRYPDNAFLPFEVKQILLDLKKKPGFHLAIISGRELGDLKKKIDIPGIIYSGNHGLEWEIDGKRESRFIKDNKLKLLSGLRKRIEQLKLDYEGIYLEDKQITFSLHYRLIEEERLEMFKKKVERIIKPYIQSGKLTIIRGKKVYGICPKVNWTKGHVLKLLIDQMSKKQKSKLFPVYIGDDTTDEDAFFHLKEGVTVKVGKSSRSCARYYLEDTIEVIKVLEWFNNREFTS